jgi:hypothetical protein
MPPVQSRPTARKHKYDLNLSEGDVEELLKDVAFFERAALEDSSIQVMSSVRRCYTAFCESTRRPPFPVNFESLALFLIQYCHKFGNTTRSIPGTLSHLKRINRQYSNQWLDDESLLRIDDLITGLKKYDRSVPRRKLPMTHATIAAITAVSDMYQVRDYQHITMCKVAHDALLRGSELMRLKVGDLIWSQDQKQVTVVIHLSKSNKHGAPEHVTLHDYGPSSGVAYLREYVRIMRFQEQGLTSAQPLWPIVSASGEQINWSRATAKTHFVGYIRLLLERAGYDGKLYSGHSFRSGGAIDLWASHRCRARTIQLFGRWKSDAYRLYIRDNPDATMEEVASAMAFFVGSMGSHSSSPGSAISDSQTMAT